MKRISLILYCVIYFIIPAIAQTKMLDKGHYGKYHVGVGVGYEYGLMGTQVIYYPYRVFGLVAGGGYTFIGLGGVLGVKARVISLQDHKPVVPFFIALYGINGVVKIKNADQYNMSSTGTLFGAGLDLNRKDNQHYSSISLLVPQRTRQFKDHIEFLENNPAITLNDPLFPVTIAFGLHLMIK